MRYLCDFIKMWKILFFFFLFTNICIGLEEILLLALFWSVLRQCPNVQLSELSEAQIFYSLLPWLYSDQRKIYFGIHLPYHHLTIDFPKKGFKFLHRHELNNEYFILNAILFIGNFAYSFKTTTCMIVLTFFLIYS